MAYFPLFVDLEGRQVLVVGGGKIAMRKQKSLPGNFRKYVRNCGKRFSGRKNDMMRRTLKVWEMWEKLLDLYLFLQQQPRR